MEQKRKIVLFAHESQMDDLLGWANFFQDFLSEYELYAIGATANLLTEKLQMDIHQFQRDLLQDQAIQIETPAMMPVDFLVFFCHPSEILPLDPDLEALLEIANSGSIPVAANRAAADFMFPAYLM
jgi:methylglyoxal synthase